MTFYLKRNKRVKELVSIFLITIRRIMTEMFSRAKKVAHQKNFFKKKKSRNDRHGCWGDELYENMEAKYTKLLISNEKLFRRECRPNIAPVSKYNKMWGSPLGL